MALSTTVETWVNKQAQIEKKKLEIEDLHQSMADEIEPLQTQIVNIQSNYGNQIATKNEEIAQLLNDIRSLAIG